MRAASESQLACFTPHQPAAGRHLWHQATLAERPNPGNQRPSARCAHRSPSNLSSRPTQETFKPPCAKFHPRSQRTEIELSSDNKSVTSHWPEKKSSEKTNFFNFHIFQLPDFKTFQQLSFSSFLRDIHKRPLITIFRNVRKYR